MLASSVVFVSLFHVLQAFSTQQQKTLAFISTRSSSSSSSSSHSRLYISSWGKSNPNPRWKEQEKEADPEKQIQSYLKEPTDVEARSSLDGTCLVSGWVKSLDRTDQTVFDFLNSEESNFHFSKIIAFVDDAKFAKKRLISRSARYTGLLDKLDFMEAGTVGALPSVEQLQGVKNWVANVGKDVSLIAKIADLAHASATVENISILVTDGQDIDPDIALSSVQSLDKAGKTFTIVVVGTLKETPEGSVPYQICDFGTAAGALPSNATYSRDESLRLVTECLGLKSSINKAMVFSEVTNVNQTEAKLVRGLREGGYNRAQEIDHMIAKGATAYQKAIDDYKVRVPARTPQDDWLVQKQKELDESTEVRRERTKREYEEKKQKEVEEIAREWAKREYFRKSMAGDMPFSEEEYVKSVWERAMFEGDLKYRMLRGQDTDERKELAEFKKKQEKKKAAMLERARLSLQEALKSDSSGESKALVGKDGNGADEEDEDDDDEDDE